MNCTKFGKDIEHHNHWHTKIGLFDPHKMYREWSNVWGIQFINFSLRPNILDIFAGRVWAAGTQWARSIIEEQHKNKYISHPLLLSGHLGGLVKIGQKRRLFCRLCESPQLLQFTVSDEWHHTL